MTEKRRDKSTRPAQDLPLLDRKRQAVEAALGRAIIIRGVRTPQARWKGRVYVSHGRIILEYQISEFGFFWHAPVIEQLLEAIASGETDVILPA